MTLSNQVIPKEEGEALSLWDLPIVGEGEAPTIVPHAEKLLPTAEDIEAIQAQAYQEAYDAAFAEAQSKGFDEGKQQGHQAGFDEGKSEGYKLGLAEGQEVINEKTGQLSAIIASLAGPLQELDDEVETELVSLAMVVARHLLRRELRTEPSHVIAAVRQAVELLPMSAQNIRVVLHPDDAVIVREALAVNDEEKQRWKITEDPMLTRGGCTVETENSRIDATVEARLNTVVSQVLGGERGMDNVSESINHSQ